MQLLLSQCLLAELVEQGAVGRAIAACMVKHYQQGFIAGDLGEPGIGLVGILPAQSGLGAGWSGVEFFPQLFKRPDKQLAGIVDATGLPVSAGSDPRRLSRVAGGELIQGGIKILAGLGAGNVLQLLGAVEYRLAIELAEANQPVIAVHYQHWRGGPLQ